jgi:hypothetical protein
MKNPAVLIEKAFEQTAIPRTRVAAGDLKPEQITALRANVAIREAYGVEEIVRGKHAPLYRRRRWWAWF